MTYEQALHFYRYIESRYPHWNYLIACMGLVDRFFFIYHVLNRDDILHPWLYERVREVEAEPDGCLDFWAREHYKSTILTFAGSLQEIARTRGEITIGIFSHNRPIAKSFLGQIKAECENNPRLHQLYPDAFWQHPKRQSPVWSLDLGLVMRRKSNPAAATVEAWGLVDSQPVGKHFRLLIYDDVVTAESVTGPDMITKTTDRWELSEYLSARQLDENGEHRPPRKWVIGTRYSYADTYEVMLSRGTGIPRIYPATDDGTPEGKPVFLTQQEWDLKKKNSSPSTLACQMLQNPLAGEEQEFKEEWIRYWEVRPQTMNVAILVDPASSKKKGSSLTAMPVVGIDASHNKYFLDGMCHKMSLTDKWNNLKRLHQKWIRQPGVQVVHVAYEKYGMQADIEHMEQMMEIERYWFPITEVSWTRESEQSKLDRIRRLIPDHQNWRFFYPYKGPLTEMQAWAVEQGRGFLLSKPIKRKNHENRLYDLVEYLIENEYKFFPATTRLDLLDAMSRIYDIDLNPAQLVDEDDVYPEEDEI
jgi:hypothetical protein